MRKQLTLILFLYLIINNVLSQEENKTIAFATFQFLSPTENSMVAKDNRLNFSFGMGIGLNLKTKFSESSSLVYGLELASTRNNYLFDGFSVFGSFSQFKFPIYHQYSLPLDRRKKNIINLFLGTEILVQQYSEIGGSLSSSASKKYEIVRIGGFFPLLKFGFGYDLKFKSNYFIGFEAGYNLGFTKAMEVSFINEEQIVEYNSNLSHIHFKVLFPLNARRSFE